MLKDAKALTPAQKRGPIGQGSKNNNKNKEQNNVAQAL
jgi:hypothetical protein